MRKNRFLAGVLAVVMLLGMLPGAAFAAETVDLSKLENISADAALSHSVETTGQWLPQIDDIAHLTNENYDDQFRWVHGGIHD